MENVHSVMFCNRKQLMEREYSKIFESKLSNLRDWLSLNKKSFTAFNEEEALVNALQAEDIYIYIYTYIYIYISI